MYSDFPALRLPELSVDQKKLFKISGTNPQLIYILMNEFDGEGDEPFFTGLVPDETDLSENKQAPLLKELARHLLKEYEDIGRNRWKHADQRRVLEKAIRLLDKSHQAEENVSLELGKAYLYRARIIRPKGFTVPAKKIEALNNALHFCEDATNHGKAWADHFAGLVALELYRCGKTHDNLSELLNKATADAELSEPDRRVEFYQMRVRLEELRQDEGNGSPYFIQNVLTKIFEFQEPGMELEKLKVSLQSPSSSKDKISSSLEDLILVLKEYPFSHPLWEDTVRFARRLYFNRLEFWKELALRLWEAAEDESRKISSVHLRWYWSRQRDLYDLSFLAALKQGNPNLAAQVTDSAKSRPALSWQAIERLKHGNEELKDEIENYAQALSGGYIKGLLKPYRKPEVPNEEKPFFEQHLIDNNLIAIQFYLVHLEEFEKVERSRERGYALIYDQESEKKWSFKTFDFAPIWEKYVAWQSVYFDLPPQQRDASGTQLRYLCEALGKALEFLFKSPEKQFSSNEKSKDILFIPHDFLHRVPLHGAMLDNENVLLKTFNCFYLPAISYSAKNQGPQQNKNSVLLYYSGKSEESDDPLFNHLKTKFDTPINFASATDLLDAAQNPPSLLVLYCHGEADATNPYLSRLKLKDDLMLLDFASAAGTFTGSKIFLGACETDLMPPLDAPLDEQISMATIFLIKRSESVIGSMWEAKRMKVLNLLFMKEGLFDHFFEQQREWWKEEYEHTDSNTALYDCLCFRMYRCYF